MSNPQPKGQAHTGTVHLAREDGRGLRWRICRRSRDSLHALMNVPDDEPLTCKRCLAIAEEGK